MYFWNGINMHDIFCGLELCSLKLHASVSLQNTHEQIELDWKFPQAKEYVYLLCLLPVSEQHTG